MTRAFGALLAFAAVAGCATPEQRVRGALTEAGLPDRIAACMAGRMVDRLSLVQLRRLQSLGSLPQVKLGETGVGDLLHRVRALKDPEILAVVTTAGLGCAF